VLALALVVAACAEDDEPTPEERREALVAQLSEDLVAETEGALSDGQATCVAEALADTVGEDRFPDVVAAAAGDGDPDLRDTVIDVFASCDALEPLVEHAE
jgi:hypothetical protein